MPKKSKMTRTFFSTVWGGSGISLLLLLSACGGGDSGQSNTAAQSTEVSTPSTAVSGSGFSSGSNMRTSDSTISADIASLSSTLVTSGSFNDELTFFDTSRWQAANWSNWGYFVNGWHPNQLSFVNGRMEIKLQADTAGLTGEPAVSGEYRTNATYKYGLYKARLIASATPGTITAFFTYAGSDTGKPHDEIDIELKGDDLTKMQVNYWTNGVEHPTLIDLGFNASAAYHDYAFHWTATGIDWFVDGKLVHSENGSRGALPVTPGQIILNYWGTIYTWPWSTDYIVSSPPSVMSVENVSFASDTPVTVSVVSVSALSGSSYADTSKGWRAVASVTVRNASGIAVPGAVVTGGFTTGGAPLSCTTASNGVCSITSSKISTSTSSTTFSISGVAGTNMTYDATKNVKKSVAITKP